MSRCKPKYEEKDRGRRLISSRGFCQQSWAQEKYGRLYMKKNRGKAGALKRAQAWPKRGADRRRGRDRTRHLAPAVQKLLKKLTSKSQAWLPRCRPPTAKGQGPKAPQPAARNDQGPRGETTLYKIFTFEVRDDDRLWCVGRCQVRERCFSHYSSSAFEDWHSESCHLL